MANDQRLAGEHQEDDTPLGDSPEVHDEIAPEDLPPAHPGRGRAERQAEGSDGTTEGDR